MKALTETDRELCSLQGAVFESSLTASDASSAVFVRRFMNSDVARRLDVGAISFETATPEQMAHEVDAQYGNARYGSERFSAGELHWMGYLYRYWCCSTGMSSKAVYRVVSAREMRALYGPYHTLDPERALSELMGLKGVRPLDDLSRGVEILARIRARRS